MPVDARHCPRSYPIVPGYDNVSIRRHKFFRPSERGQPEPARGPPVPPSSKTILLIGASRGLGCAMAAEYLKHGWNVVGTVRGTARTPLHDLADKSEGRVEIETVDINEPDEVAALRARLSGRTFDVLFVNAGVTNNPKETIAEVA